MRSSASGFRTGGSPPCENPKCERVRHSARAQSDSHSDGQWRQHISRIIAFAGWARHFLTATSRHMQRGQVVVGGFPGRENAAFTKFRDDKSDPGDCLSSMAVPNAQERELELRRAWAELKEQRRICNATFPTRTTWGLHCPVEFKMKGSRTGCRHGGAETDYQN